MIAKLDTLLSSFKYILIRIFKNVKKLCYSTERSKSAYSAVEHHMFLISK